MENIIYTHFIVIINNMKEKYCKFCGLELDNGSCSCEAFLKSSKNSNSKINDNINKKINQLKSENSNYIICDTCKTLNDKDSVYCAYCGLPLKVNGNIKKLKDELSGKNAVDVIGFYKKQDKKAGINNSSLKDSKLKYLVSILLSAMIVCYSLFFLIIPYIKQKIIENQIRKELENSETVEYAYAGMENAGLYETSIIEETSQQKIDLREKWIKQGGFFYAFDKNGDPVIDDWVTETDENGVEQKYYFDVDGKLVVDSWIDGEYYVGDDGAMLKNSPTPDGAFVDEEGKVIIQNENNQQALIETHVYYESPNSEAETVVASRQKSSTSAKLKGADSTKELYIKNLVQLRETVTKGDLKCNIIYYLPVIDGIKEKEVKNINDGLKERFEDLKNELINVAMRSIEFPKSITINEVEQRTLTNNRLNIIVHGKIYPRHGLIEKRKYRFIYDRKSKKVMLSDITEY